MSAPDLRPREQPEQSSRAIEGAVRPEPRTAGSVYLGIAHIRKSNAEEIRGGPRGQPIASAYYSLGEARRDDELEMTHHGYGDP